MRRNAILIAMVLFASLVFTACGAGSPKKTESAPSAAPMTPSNAAAPAEQKAPAADTAGGSSSGGGLTVPTDRKMILNANYDLRIKDADEAVTRIDQAVRSTGGYVQEVKQTGTKAQGRTVHMMVRVPSRQYGAIKDLIREQGEINGQREWADDVTEQFVDLEERIKTKEVHLQRLQSHFAQAGTIKEMIELEQEIGRVTADLESMKGRMKVMANQVEFSTFVINLYEPGVPTPIQPPKTVWERMQRGFTGSWNGVVNFTGNLAVFLVSALPVLVYLAILGALGWLIARPIRRKVSNRFKAPPPGQQ